MIDSESIDTAKGLLTPENCVLAMIDMQPLTLFAVSNIDRTLIINNNMLLAKAAKAFDIPVIFSTIETKGFGGYIWPQVQAVFPNQVPIERTKLNAWEDEIFKSVIDKIGRNNLLLAGLWTGTGIALPAIQAIHDGYDVHVVEDCCGDVSTLAHRNAMTRMALTGAKPVTATSLMLEWQRDWSRQATYDAVLDIAMTHCGAFGSAIEYIATMVHGAPTKKPPEYIVPGSILLEQARVVSKQR